MSARTFFDSNVLVYTDDASAPAKQKRALELFGELDREGNAVVSLQVLQEYFVAATRKLGVDAQAARRKVELFALNVAVPSLDDVVAAIDLHRLHGLSFWDAMIVRSAGESGCRVLLSEDLQHGRVINGVRIENPFR